MSDDILASPEDIRLIKLPATGELRVHVYTVQSKTTRKERLNAPRGLAGALPPAPRLYLYRLEVLRHAHGLAIAEGPLQFYYHSAVGIH